MTNTRTLLSNETLIFSAVLTDPDGVDDLIGGTLKDPSTNGSYGSFATEASEGSYTLSLVWNAIQTVDPILMNPTGVDRTFRAEFFDVAGNSATQDITVHLDCSGAGDGTCGSACESFSGDYQCGACDRACPNEATCSSFTCRWLDSQSTRGTCNDLCQAQGRRCFDDIGPAGQGQYDQPNQDLYVSVALCTDIPAPSVDTSPFVAMTCWCYEPRPSWYADL